MFSPLFKKDDSPPAHEVKFVKEPDNIDKPASTAILVESFIREYQQYLDPKDIGPGLDSWREGDNSVQKYYEKYFREEFHEFASNKLDYWVQVTVGGKLAGWATFVKESNDPNSVYMNLLVVHPDYQRQGIGEKLVNALITENEIPELNAINLLLRKKNEGGRKFYTKLGFSPNPDYQRDNFVDPDLLEGFSWKRPALVNRFTA